ncbi:MAG: class II aldolase/adducin family protein [Candidatus Thorarchaeota archaeon]|nr:MAG: class II aldolase/adducin family protein [Candidatus Thorarchaeota archaeon]
MIEQISTSLTTLSGRICGSVMIEVYEDTKKELLDICLKMVENDLVIGSSGNASVRVDDHVVITPSSIHYTEMKAEDMVVLDLNGAVVEGSKNPSVEWQMHLELYNNRSIAGAVVHTHSIYASAMAVLNESLPPIIDETVPKLGSHIRVSEYAIPGTKQLGTNVGKAIEERSAALIANHGAVCIAKTLEKALHLSIVLERTCKIYMISKQRGTPKHLPDEVVEDEQDLWEMMSGY